MSLNGCRINKSLSPVNMAATLALNASERYLSSLGSRQYSTLVVIGIKRLIRIKSSRNESRFSSEMYLSNFLSENTVAYSRAVSSEMTAVPIKIALLNASEGFELLNKAALNSTLVSITKDLSGTDGRISEEIFK